MQFIEREYHWKMPPKTKFHTSVITKIWKKALWLDVASHVTSFNQSQAIYQFKVDKVWSSIIWLLGWLRLVVQILSVIFAKLLANNVPSAAWWPTCFTALLPSLLDRLPTTSYFSKIFTHFCSKMLQYDLTVKWEF